jgi:site-specific recombinase XerD
MGARRSKTLQVIYPNGVKLLDARKAIGEWISERPASAYLFPNPQDGPLSRITVYNIFKKHAAAAKLPQHKSAPHSLKYSLGQHLHDSGQPIEVMAACLGHARIDSRPTLFQHLLR